MITCASIDIGEKNLSILIGSVKSRSRSRNNKISNPKTQLEMRSFLDKITIKELHLINLSDPADTGTVIGCDEHIKTGANKGKECGRPCLNGAQKCKIHNKAGGSPIAVGPKRKQLKIYTNKQQFCVSVITALDKLKLDDIDLFIIERQPPKNKIMNEVSHYVFMYLSQLIYKRNDTKQKIVYFNAKKRMASLCTLFADECKKSGIVFAGNDKYYNRKQNSIKLATYLLGCIKHTDNVKSIDKYRKKDDIADCLMQLLFYFI